MLYTDFKFLRGSERAELVLLIKECMTIPNINYNVSSIQDEIFEDLLNSLEMKLLEDDEFPFDINTDNNFRFGIGA